MVAVDQESNDVESGLVVAIFEEAVVAIETSFLNSNTVMDGLLCLVVFVIGHFMNCGSKQDQEQRRAEEDEDEEGGIASSGRRDQHDEPWNCSSLVSSARGFDQDSHMLRLFSTKRLGQIRSWF